MRKYLFFLGALLMIAPAISEARVYCKSTNTGRFCAGLSTDTKPTVAETNDEFFETDTKDLYKYAGAAWSLYVNGSAAGGVGGNASEYVDDDDFVDGTTVGQLLQGVAEATGSAVTDGDIGALGMTVKRALKVTIVDNNDDSAVDATANAVIEVGDVISGSLSDDGDIDALEAVGTITTSFNYSSCSVVFTNTVTLTAFQVLLSNDAGSTYSIIAGGASGTTSADYTSPYGHVHSTSGDLTTAASGSTHRIQLDGLLPWNRVQFKAASTNGDMTATYACVYGPGR